MLVLHFPALKVLAVLAEVLADNVVRLTAFIRISPAGNMRGAAPFSGPGGERRNFPGYNGH